MPKRPPTILSPQELEFIDKVYAGEYQTNAYMAAFGNNNYKSCSVMASRLLDDVRVIEEMEGREAAVSNRGRRRLNCMINKAMDGLDSLLEYSSPLDTVKLRTILAILDRTGFPAKSQQEVSGSIGTTFQFVGIDDNTFPAAQKPDEADDDE